MELLLVALLMLTLATPAWLFGGSYVPYQGSLPWIGLALLLSLVLASALSRRGTGGGNP